MHQTPPVTGRTSLDEDLLRQDQNESNNTKAQKPSLSIKRGCAQLLAAWVAIAMPLQTQYVYAETVGGVKALSEAERRLEAEIVNSREKRLSAGNWTTTGPATPRPLGATTGPVRMPNLIADPSDAALAGKAAQKNKPLTVGETVRRAQDASNFAQQQGLLATQDSAAYSISDTRVDPEQSTSGKHKRINAQEMFPGYNQTTIGNLMSAGQTMYDEPEKIRDIADAEKRRYTQEGCRQTRFITLHKQSINSAPSSAVHRILKVEFFDIQKTPIPSTNPVEYQRVMTATTFKKGTVKLNYPTLGGTTRQWYDYVGEDYAIRYTYTPYTAPKNENYFTYNHRLAVANPSLTVYPQTAISNFGTPKDAFTPTVSQSIPNGVTAVYLSADLFQTEVEYTPITSAASCQPDPPASCEVPAKNDGTIVRWCGGSPGAGVMEMYDDVKNPSSAIKARRITEQSMAQGGMDPSFASGIARALSADKSDRAQAFAGTCSRQAVATRTSNMNLQYGTEDITFCSNVLVNPYPQPCNTIKRSFGISKLADHRFLTYRAFNKIAVPIIDPATGNQVKVGGVPQFTYRKEPANVTGTYNLSTFPVVGTSTCAPGSCTQEIPDNPNGSSAGYYVEWDHTPIGMDPMSHAVSGVSADGGTATASHYGTPAQNWTISGSASASGGMHELRVLATVQMVTINRLDGCERYLDFVADGYCKPGKLTCLSESPTRTIGGVTFGPGLPTSGIVDLLKKWGTDGRAQVNALDNGEGEESLQLEDPILLLDKPMCWEARAEAFDTCITDPTPNYREFTKGNEIWASDCHLVPNPEGVPLESSSCVRKPEKDSCDSRMEGAFTGACYSTNIAYDCGEAVSSTVTTTTQEMTDVCSGTMRCLGTECHRPNLTGSNAEQFTKAAAGMEAWNMAKDEMYCEETGAKPTEASQACTPMIFGGEPYFCKIPIGNQIGITPHCCNEAKEGAKSAPSALDYLRVMNAVSKLNIWENMANVMSQSGIYNSTAATFGEVAKPITDVYSTASTYITENFVQPFGAAFDSFLGSFGIGGTTTQVASQVGTDAIAKSGVIDGLLAQVKSQIINALGTLVIDILGVDLGATIFQATASGYVLTEGAAQVLQVFNVVMLVYSILKIIGHIVFKCQDEEYEWGMKQKWGLCASAGSCCNKKNERKMCIETRNLFCCYGSIATRVIAQQIVSKNLTGTRAHGFKTGGSGESLKKCKINCGGFTPMELATVDWGQVDLSEWTDTLIKADLLKPDDHASNLSVTTNSVPFTNIAAREAANNGELDNRVPAVKTTEGIGQNIGEISSNTETLRNATHCYGNDDRKMPYTYPECNQTDCGNIKGVTLLEGQKFDWYEDKATGEWILEYKSHDNQYGQGLHNFNALVNIRNLSQVEKFVIEWMSYDDWMILKVNGHNVFNGPHGGDMLDICPNGKVKIHSAGACDQNLELMGIPHGDASGGVNLNLDLKPFLKKGENPLTMNLAVGGRGEFSIRIRTKQHCGPAM